MSQRYTKDFLLEQVRNLALAKGVTFDVTKGNLEDLAKQAVAAAKILQDYLESDN